MDLLDNTIITSILSSIDQAVIITDLEGQIIYWNEQATSLYGYEKGEIIGKNVNEALMPQISQQQGQAIMDRLRNGESWSGEFIVHNKYGREFEVFVTDAPLYDGEDLIGIIGFSTDLNPILKERYHQLISHLSFEMDKRVGQITSEITHKLNNNLMIVNSNLEIMKTYVDELNSTQFEELLEDAIYSGQEIKKLTEKVQVLNGTSSFSATQTDMKELGQNVKSLFDSLSILDINLELTDDQLQIIIDENQLERIIFSLLLMNKENNLHFGKLKKVDLSINTLYLNKIDLDSIKMGDQLKPGKHMAINLSIPSEKLVSLIEFIEHPLLHEDTEMLLLVNSLKGLITGYHGGLKFDKKTNQLTIIFPIVQKEKDGEVSDTEKTMIKRGAQVLLVEDNPIIQKSLQQMISKIELKPIAMGNGLEAKKAIDSKLDYAMGVIDLKIPGMNGIELVEYIRKSNSEIPILLISGYHEEINTLFQNNYERSYFLAKPFTEDQFRDKISRMITIDTSEV